MDRPRRLEVHDSVLAGGDVVNAPADPHRQA
jgi:hypothetical protein